MIQALLSLLRSTSGATAIEYAILASMLAVVAAGAAAAMGPIVAALLTLPIGEAASAAPG